MLANTWLAPPAQTLEGGALSQVYLSAEQAIEVPSGQSLLGVMEHAGGISKDQRHGDVPTALLTMNALGGHASREVWLTDQPVRYGTLGEIRYARSDNLLFGVGRYPAEDLEQVTYQAYCDLTQLVHSSEAGRLIRLWNYFPGINEPQNNLECYRRFCRGRHNALTRMGSGLSQDLPAATAVGSSAGDFWVIFLAGKGACRQVENPLQMSAFHYPPIHGPRSPSFSRAVRYSSPGGDLLFISGTASIRGHETVHGGDLVGQCLTTVENLRALLKQAGTNDSGPWGNRVSWKVYLRREGDFETVRDFLEQTLDPADPILYVTGDICRSSLLLEIEGLVHL